MIVLLKKTGMCRSRAILRASALLRTPITTRVLCTPYFETEDVQISINHKLGDDNLGLTTFDQSYDQPLLSKLYVCTYVGASDFSWDFCILLRCEDFFDFDVSFFSCILFISLSNMMFSCLSTFFYSVSCNTQVSCCVVE